MDMFLMSCPWNIACTKDPKIKKKILMITGTLICLRSYALEKNSSLSLEFKILTRLSKIQAQQK